MSRRSTRFATNQCLPVPMMSNARKPSSATSSLGCLVATKTSAHCMGPRIKKKNLATDSGDSIVGTSGRVPGTAIVVMCDGRTSGLAEGRHDDLGDSVSDLFRWKLHTNAEQVVDALKHGHACDRRELGTVAGARTIWMQR